MQLLATFLIAWLPPSDQEQALFTCEETAPHRTSILAVATVTLSSRPTYTGSNNLQIRKYIQDISGNKILRLGPWTLLMWRMPQQNKQVLKYCTVRYRTRDSLGFRVLGFDLFLDDPFTCDSCDTSVYL